jgi:hypothetical protein
MPLAESGTEALQVIMVATGAGEGNEGVNVTVISAEDIAANANPAIPIRENCKVKLAIFFLFLYEHLGRRQVAVVRCLKLPTDLFL